MSWFRFKYVVIINTLLDLSHNACAYGAAMLGGGGSSQIDKSSNFLKMALLFKIWGPQNFFEL